MGIIKLAYSLGLYSMAAAGVLSIGAIGYSAVSGLTAKEEPKAIVETVEQSPREEMSDIIKEIMAKEMMGGSFERIIEKRSETRANSKLKEYIDSEKLIEELKKHPSYNPD